MKDAGGGTPLMRWPTPQQQAQELGVQPTPFDVARYPHPEQPDYAGEAYYFRRWTVTIPAYRTPAAASSLNIGLSGQFPRGMQIDPAMPSGGVALDWVPDSTEVSEEGTVYAFQVVYQLVVNNQAVTLPSPTFTITAYDRSYLDGTLEDEPSISRYAKRRRINLKIIPWADPANPQGLLALRHLDPTPVGYRTYALTQRNDALLRQIEDLENGDYITLLTPTENELGIVPKVDAMVLGQRWRIDFTNREPPYKTIWFQGAGLPAEVRVQEMPSPQGEVSSIGRATGVNSVAAFNGKLYAEAGSNLHEIDRETGRRTYKAGFFGYSLASAVFDGFLIYNTDRGGGRRTQIFNATFSRDRGALTETWYAQPNISGIPNYAGPRILPPPAPQRAPFFVGMATPSEDAVLGWGLSDTHVYNLWSTEGYRMTASLKPISEAGVVDTSAADRGPHGLSNPRALAYWRDRLVVVDGREVKVINLDSGQAVGAAIATLPTPITGLTVIDGELVGVTLAGYPIRISAFEARTGADAPAGLAASAVTDTSAALSWTTVRGFRYQGLGGTNRASWASIATPFTFTGLSPNTRSPLSVRSLFQGIGGTPATIEVLTLPDAPDVVLHAFTATSATFQAQLEAGERLERRRRLAPAAWSAWTAVTLNELGRFAETGLTSGASYEYEFRARNDLTANAGTPLAGGISPAVTAIPVDTGVPQPSLTPGVAPIFEATSITLSIVRIGGLDYEYRTSLNPGPDANPTLTDMPANGTAIAGWTANAEQWIEVYSRGENQARSTPLRLTFLTPPLPPSGIGRPSQRPTWAQAGDVVADWTEIAGLTYEYREAYRYADQTEWTLRSAIMPASNPPILVNTRGDITGLTQGIILRAKNALTAEQTGRGVLLGGPSAWSNPVALPGYR